MNNRNATPSSDSLAIVIPAYKEAYFEKALNSLARQTNKNFIVYIGDDGSPFNLVNIVEKFSHILDIRYTKFTNNIGSKELVFQWDRCVKLTTDEKWIWLFSDDDIADETCVENFYKILNEGETRFDVYRFNVDVIDKNDAFIYSAPTGPEEESSEEMAYHLLKGDRGNSMPDHIFSREVYNYSKGFVFTDYAQGADWATSILFSKNKGIRIIPESKVYWRYSGDNISSMGNKNKDEMILGHIQFLSWTKKHFEYLKNSDDNINYDMIMHAIRINFRMVMINHFKGFKWNNTIKMHEFLNKNLELSYIDSFKELVLINIINPIFSKLVKLKVNLKSAVHI